MAIKALYYVFAIFSVIIFFLLSQEPYFIDIKSSSSDIAKIQMNDVKDYEMNDDKIIRVLSAKKATRFEKEDVLDGVYMSFLKDKFIYNVKSLHVIYRDDLIFLKDDVEANRSDNISFKTQEMVYDINNKIAKSKERFTYKSKFLDIEGKEFFYDLEKKDIKTGNLHAIYEMEKK